MQNHTLEPYVAPAFSPPSYAIAVNALFFASLGVVLVAAFLCMLVKGWIRELDRKLRGITDLRKRAVIKELRDQGLLRWWLPELVTILPSLIHLSLILFFIGLAVYLSQIHKLPAFTTLSIFGIGVVVYVLSIFISAIDDFSPFRSPYSRALGALYRRVYSHVYSRLVYSPRRFPTLMALPRTINEKILERVSTFIRAHNPVSEQAIADHDSGPITKEVISRTSVPVLNRVLNSVNRSEPSANSRNIFTSVLLQLDDINIRPPIDWYLPWHYDTSSLSIKEAKCLAYTTCTLRSAPCSAPFLKIIRAGIELLDQTSDPWSHLVSALIPDRYHSERDEFSDIGSWWAREAGFAGQEAGLLQSISNVEVFDEEQWCFVITSIAIVFARYALPEDIPALTRILVRLLEKGVHFGDGPFSKNNEHVDLWLYVMMTVLHEEMPAAAPNTSKGGETWHARDLEMCGKGMTRDPINIRRLLRLSKYHNLDLVLMRGCLVPILYILISHNPRDQQARSLINEYLDIIMEEMDVPTWSFALSELLLHSGRSYSMPETVLCLLRGECLDVLGDLKGGRREQTIMQDYDLKLIAINAQPTTSILRVMDNVIRDQSLLTGLELHNSWLSLYTSNFTTSSHRSAIPVVWSSDCTSIASKRLDLYDRRKIAPEADLVIFFLSSPSTSIACRALHWYLRLEVNTTTSCDTRYFISFPIIFRRGLCVDENRQGWLLLVDMLLPSWDSVLLEWQTYFVEAFFGYGDSQGDNQGMTDQSAAPAEVEDERISDPLGVGAAVSTGQADGLGWMEDVWMTLLRGLVVRIDRAKAYWPELSGVVHATYPESAQPTESTSLVPLSPQGTSSETRVVLGPKTLEEHLEDSARDILRVLTRLLEVGVGSMPVALLDRIRNSVLLSEERLDHDVDSLSRIRVLLSCNQEE
jgi:hypothetical protein